MEFLKGFSKPGVVDFINKIVNHFDKDKDCSHANDECFEVGIAFIYNRCDG